MKKFKGFTLIELLIVVAIIAILAAIAVPNFLEAQVRSKVSRVKADQRSLATGLEAYYVDNNDFPEFETAGLAANGFAPAGSGAQLIRTFRVRASGTDYFHTITTPQAYITGYFGDPFADTKGCNFAYYKDTNGWIIASFGPDTDEAVASAPGDLGFATPFSIETIYQSNIAQPSTYLITGSAAYGTPNDAFTYDPTNGTVTPGDVYRVKQ